MIKIYRFENKISHITFSLGKRWISFDRSGIMAWTGKRNRFLIYRTMWNKKSAF